MSDMRIKSGSGNGKSTHVTTDNRLQVAARTETLQDHEVEIGGGYNFNPGVINLTGTTESALLYLKNTGDDPIIVPGPIYMVTAVAGTLSGYWRFRILAGTNLTGNLITGGTAFTPVNRYIGSANTLDADAVYGSYASACSGGDTLVETIQDSGYSGRFVVPVPFFIPKGGQIAILVTAPTGTTSADVMVAIAPYVKTVDD